jgi:hypothetical protein
MTPAERERYLNDLQRVQARSHLRRGVRPAKTPQWVRDCECRVETLPLFELGQTTRDDQGTTGQNASSKITDAPSDQQ